MRRVAVVANASLEGGGTQELHQAIAKHETGKTEATVRKRNFSQAPEAKPAEAPKPAETPKVEETKKEAKLAVESKPAEAPTLEERKKKKQANRRTKGGRENGRAYVD